MFFPLKLIVRREIFGSLTTHQIAVKAFHRSFTAGYSRPYKKSDTNYHFMKGWD